MSQSTSGPGRDRPPRAAAARRAPDDVAGPLGCGGSNELAARIRPLDDVLDQALLLEIRSINLRGTALIQSAARGFAALEPAARTTAAAVGGVGAFVATGLDDWLALDAAACDRVASQPFLLFEVALEDPSRWQRLLGGAVVDEPAGSAARVGPETPLVGYARVLLHYAWHLARTAPRTAAIVAGMAPDTAVLLRRCYVEQLDEIVPRCAHWLQPRWGADRPFWSELLAAARAGGDPERHRRMSLRALQRIGGSLARSEPS